MSDTQRYFTELAAQYNQTHYAGDLRYPALKIRQHHTLEMLRRFRAGGRKGRVLDLGCGPGPFLPQLGELFEEVWALDVSPEMLSLAAEKAGACAARCLRVQGDAEHLPFRDQSFDAIVAAGVLEYMETDGPMLAELRRLLRPGGIFVGNVTTLGVVGLLDPVVRLLKGLGPLRWLYRNWITGGHAERAGESGMLKIQARKHSAKIFVDQLARAGLQKSDSVYFHFSPLPRPFQMLLRRIAIPVGLKMEAWGRRPWLGTLGEGYLVEAVRLADRDFCTQGTRPKVALISQATGGVQEHIMKLLEGLDRGRWDLHAVVSEADHVRGADPEKLSFPQALKEAGVPAHFVDMRREICPVGDPRALGRLVRLLRRERFDVVHTHSSKAGFLGRLAACIAGVPVVLHTPHSIAVDRPGAALPVRAFYAILEWLAGKCCDCVMALSSSEQALLRAWRIVPGYKIRMIPNGVDLASLAQRAGDPDEKRRELGIESLAPVLVMVGRLAPQKAPQDFVSAAALVLRRFPNARFLYVGDGPLLEQTQEQIDALGLGSSVQLMGWRSDAPAIVGCADLVLLSSLWEGMPYTVLEGMALGKPVVATAATGTVDLLKDGVGGVLTPLHDPQAMSEAICRLLERPDEARKMGAAGREKVRTAHSLDAQLKAVDELYADLLRWAAARGRFKE
ncbi:MAG: glycosyltransferase [Candidatus Omnitrophica bacterium]|nr:glycosyltransferase [Candidatus Omnitrophota bacterium]